MKRNEVLDTVIAELEGRGITDYNVERLSKHIRVAWRQGKEEKCQVVPLTSSDVRSRLNARADVRRALNGYVPPGKPMLLKALEVPRERYDMREHITRLEQRIDDLTELLLEFMAPRGKETARDKVLAVMSSTQYLTPADISRASGVSPAYVSNVLSALSKEGLVVCYGHGQWRKV